MNHLTKEYVTKLKDSLLFINAVVIIYNASLFLLSTKYISVHYYARDFLNKVSYITRTPQNIFFESIFLFIILFSIYFTALAGPITIYFKAPLIPPI